MAAVLAVDAAAERDRLQAEADKAAATAEKNNKKCKYSPLFALQAPPSTELWYS
jgi:hypothetical protein